MVVLLLLFLLLLLLLLILVLSSALLFQQVCLFKAVWQSLADLKQSTPAFFLSPSLLCLDTHFQYSQEELSLSQLLHRAARGLHVKYAKYSTLSF